MKKVKVVELHWFERDITIGKVYDVFKELSDEGVYIINDKGKISLMFKHQYEVVNESNYVWVKDNDYHEWIRAILITDLGKRFISRYIVVDKTFEDAYLKGDNNINYISYKQMKPINPTLERIEELEKELAELKQQVNK